MRHKAGDKFIIEIKSVLDNAVIHPYATSLGAMSDEELDRLPQLISGVDTFSYNKGLEDAWEAAKKIVFNSDEGGFDMSELREIFNIESIVDIFEQYKPQGVIERFREHQKKIRLGDEVINTNKDSNFYNFKGIVIEEYLGGGKRVLWSNGRTSRMKTDCLAKTGKDKIDAFNALLGVIGE